jgi:hypothetical protein
MFKNLMVPIGHQDQSVVMFFDRQTSYVERFNALLKITNLLGSRGKRKKDSPEHLHLVLLQVTALQKFLLFAMPSQASQHNRTKQ